jgi:hypothetical protein
VTSPAGSRLSNAATSGSSMLPVTAGAESVTGPLFQYGLSLIGNFPTNGEFACGSPARWRGRDHAEVPAGGATMVPRDVCQVRTG